MTLNIGSPAHTLRAFVAAAAAEAGQPVRDTPMAGPPATALLRLRRSSGVAARHAAALYQILDYQLRPRAFSIRRSIAVLGNYAAADFDAAVAASIRAAMSGLRD